MRNRIASLIICALAAAGPARAATVAVLDTGVNTTLVPELIPFVERPGFNALFGTTDTTDSIGHGTLVAALAVGASNQTATILPVKVAVGTQIPLFAAVNGINFAAGQLRVRVINISFGGGPFNADSFRALANAVNRGKLVVMAAGNEGAPGPVQAAKAARLLQGGGIAVGAIDNNGVIRPFSNRAGDNRDFYLVAPDDPLNLGLRGTSFSAPLVSGVAATVFAQSPHLTGKQVGRILLRSATDLGAPGTDPVYGRGAVNPRAALSPIGPTGVPLSRRTAGPIALLNVEGIGAGSAWSAGLAGNSALLGSVLVLDEFERGFHVDLAGTLLEAGHTSRLPGFFTPLARRMQAVDFNPSPGLSLRVWHEDIDPDAAGRFTGPFPGFDGPRTALSLATRLTGRLDYRMDLNRPPQSALGGLVPEDAGFLNGGFGAARFAGFGNTADAGTLRYAMTEDLSLSFGAVRTHESDGYARDSEASLLAADWDVGESGTFMLQLGSLSEDGSLLGGSSRGAFSVEDTDSTSWLLGARWRLAGNLDLFGYYGRAESRPEAGGLSLIEDISTVRSETFGLGLAAGGLLQKDDRFGVAISRPLRVIDGTASLSVPQSRDLAGRTAARRERVSLAPEAAATDLEAYYYFNAGDRTRIGAHFLYTRNPNHSERLPDSLALFATLSRPF